MEEENEQHLLYNTGRKQKRINWNKFKLSITLLSDHTSRHPTLQLCCCFLLSSARCFGVRAFNSAWNFQLKSQPAVSNKQTQTFVSAALYACFYWCRRRPARTIWQTAAWFSLVQGCLLSSGRRPTASSRSLTPLIVGSDQSEKSKSSDKMKCEGPWNFSPSCI